MNTDLFYTEIALVYDEFGNPQDDPSLNEGYIQVGPLPPHGSMSTER